METFGAMAKTEKIAFILEQVRIFLYLQSCFTSYFAFGLNSICIEVLELALQSSYRYFVRASTDSRVVCQVRLCLDRKDFIRAQILSRKVNPKSFTETAKQKKKSKEAESIIEAPAPDVPTLPELRRIYYELMIRFVCLCLLL